MADAGRPPLEQLIREHYAAVYRFVRRLSGSEADAEDLTQQTFLAACRKREQLRDADRARSWLLTIARRCFLKSREAMGESLPEPEAIPETPVLENLELDEERLQAALGALPETYRTPVLLFYFEDMSYQEIADFLGAPLGTVMSRLARGKAFLRARLTGEDDPVGAVERRTQE